MTTLNARLSTMMFLEFFVWGAWYVTVGNYMAAIDMASQIHWAYTVSPIAGIVSPFFLGMIADRYFATERVLGTLHLLGGVTMLVAPLAAGSRSSGWFIALLLVHMLCYMPTLGLTNSLAFRHIADQEKEFPLIRVFGTVGWITANIVVSAVLQADATAIPLYVAGVSAVVLGLYSFTLPHTPPLPQGDVPTLRTTLGLDALDELRSGPFVIFIVSSLLICIPLAAYYSYAPVFVRASGLSDPAFKMSFGQMSEVLFMVAMPFFFARLGVKWMLTVGMAAWALRYVLFAVAAPTGTAWMILLGIALHGICYDFFFVTGQIYVDRNASARIRAQAQGFLVLVTYGVGMLIGAQVSGGVWNRVVTEGGSLERWQTFWALPAAFAIAILLFFMAAFRERSRAPVREVDARG